MGLNFQYIAIKFPVLASKIIGFQIYCPDGNGSGRYSKISGIAYYDTNVEYTKYNIEWLLGYNNIDSEDTIAYQGGTVSAVGGNAYQIIFNGLYQNNDQDQFLPIANPTS